ncbi:hypothetical protein D3C81_1032740 [compost metagenome]
MMRAYLRSDVDADLLRLADQPNRLLCAYVAHMVVNPGRFREQNIPPDMYRLRLIRNSL